MYLLIVWMGPKYMKNRPPVSCRGLLVVYNFALTLLSLYMFYEVSQVKHCACDRKCVIMLYIGSMCTHTDRGTK